MPRPTPAPRDSATAGRRAGGLYAPPRSSGLLKPPVKPSFLSSAARDCGRDHGLVSGALEQVSAGLTGQRRLTATLPRGEIGSQRRPTTSSVTPLLRRLASLPNRSGTLMLRELASATTRARSSFLPAKDE